MYLLQKCSTSHVEISVTSGTSPLRNPEAKATRISPLGTGAEVCFALASASDDTWSA